MNQYCSCINPNFCSCESDTDSSDSESEPEKLQKVKVCMFKNTGDHEAQMLSQFKSLLEGDMKNSLLETFIKTVKTKQKNKHSELPKRRPLFIDASFDRNTKTYIKFNREPKLQNTSLTNLAKEVFSLKKEVCDLKENVKRIEGDA